MRKRSTQKTRTGNRRERGSRSRTAARLRKAGLLGLAACVVLGWALATQANKRGPAPPAYGYEVVHVYPHDRGAFSQGLAFADGFLYEGTGQYGRSSLRQVDLESGKVLKYVPLPRNLFGEGITISGDQIVQLTWRSQTGLVYDRKSLKPQSVFQYAGEGWGITGDGRRLVMSDGSATLRFLDPKTFRVVDTLTVRSQGVPVDRLNELEYVEGEIFANVWGSDRIARISPETGEVTGWIDLGGLLKPGERGSPEAVLNGVAYDAKAKRLFVTGKLWPKLLRSGSSPRVDGSLLCGDNTSLTRPDSAIYLARRPPAYGWGGIGHPVIPSRMPTTSPILGPACRRVAGGRVSRGGS
jgi:glutamine cyclotransferase